MSTVTNNDLDILKEKIRKIKSEIQDEYFIEELGLFGSYVRGEQTENSDIDLLVTFKPEARFGLVTYCELENLLSEKLGKKVDLVMKKGLKPHIGKYILNEVVYL
ncbi:MAG: nucleotidyltransferase family protein [Cyanobacteria bacterium]|nr:nucleotidyltransferase family protein [Cyanobacteria bacterium CG_2015-16_32_12]NCO76991.1 nucleotidyltransferase family protein [Cyanobacteria bacterium CG_2015-22_32_23]NCQ03677.1 nucleotidyltransferase family protein [Cyanobacteria bacterium CG_2015-09_32_10]NCS85184.1 nucleotidyltransferase family protein [Cyanobacteria bacterium CG_2015-02_32_10]